MWRMLTNGHGQPQVKTSEDRHITYDQLSIVYWLLFLYPNLAIIIVESQPLERNCIDNLAFFGSRELAWSTNVDPAYVENQRRLIDIELIPWCTLQEVYDGIYYI